MHNSMASRRVVFPDPATASTTKTQGRPVVTEDGRFDATEDEVLLLAPSEAVRVQGHGDRALDHATLMHHQGGQATTPQGLTAPSILVMLALHP